ncbi:MAG TPA: hypothetical protein VJ596_09165 [Gemmatimonadaceae bacterium]|nr:hypothetical protein [Gemmatimonadaceae bacterium]
MSRLTGVLAVRVLHDEAGGIDAIHVLTTTDVNAKQVVRNVESALLAGLGQRVDHRKISVAQTKASREELAQPLGERRSATPAADTRRYRFEDLELRRSRRDGVTCRVILRRGNALLTGTATGAETERGMMELAVQATLQAIRSGEERDTPMGVSGCTLVGSRDREFAFVVIAAPVARTTIYLSGSCEVSEGPELAAALATLDATNRWLTKE